MSGLHPARASREDTPRGWHRRTGRRAGRARRRCAPLVYRGDVCVVCVTCVGENVAPSHAGSLCTQLTADTVPYIACGAVRARAARGCGACGTR